VLEMLCCCRVSAPRAKAQYVYIDKLPARVTRTDPCARCILKLTAQTLADARICETTAQDPSSSLPRNASLPRRLSTKRERASKSTSLTRSTIHFCACARCCVIICVGQRLRQQHECASTTDVTRAEVRPRHLRPGPQLSRQAWCGCAVPCCANKASA
jgi:hypothetical protein